MYYTDPYTPLSPPLVPTGYPPRNILSLSLPPGEPIERTPLLTVKYRIPPTVFPIIDNPIPDNLDKYDPAPLFPSPPPSIDPTDSPPGESNMIYLGTLAESYITLTRWLSACS